MSDYCQKCGEKIRSKIKMKCDAEQTLCGLCMDDELNSKNTLSQTMKTKYQFIHFDKKKGFWSCRNNKSGDELGIVQFYESWRQWVFAPTGPSIYSVGCMNDIVHFISQLK